MLKEREVLVLLRDTADDEVTDSVSDRDVWEAERAGGNDSCS